jgi:hypothetical protein
MGSDNTGGGKRGGRRHDRTPLCRALVAVLGIALLIWFTVRRWRALPAACHACGERAWWAGR